MDFGEALQAVKDGGRVARSGWNGRGMFLFMVERWTTDGRQDNRPLLLLPFIAMQTADGSQVPWLASQTDLLASDWVNV